MAELEPSDLPAKVRGLFADDTEAQTAINAALAAARRYCGWHVSPVRTDDEIEVDGSGGAVLSLPTLRLLDVKSVVELGTALDVDTLTWSRRKGTITKPWGRWTARDGGVVVTVTHGYTETEAADWRAAVVRLVAQRYGSKRDSADLKRKKIDDVEYEWFEAISNDSELSALFSAFRILPSP
ncbi:putative head-to-tail connector protein [Mycobacterium phage HC]|uniref:Putative head-to-tail connector protein n=1 Tax=Mycobacterium phage HC TaxID=2077135 RepID=A0A2Z5XVK4_9CAUD|nr:head-tail adaptor [Mycobacterium phage HC]BBC53883.1 putative head-to-tail connector protein [Mycobacterium phage HC]